MIATITLPGGVTATMGDDGTWSSDDDDLAGHLNRCYRPGSFGGAEVVLPPGHYAVGQAAANLRAAAEYAETPPPLPPGFVS